MITLKQIAKRLDLSTTTVGRALADNPRISRKTKERVHLVAKELGYVPNTAARIMRGEPSRLIGLLLPDVRSTFYATVAQVLSNCFENERFHLTLSLTNDNPDIEMQQARELVGARVAGIVILPCAKPRRETFDLLKMVPHVQVLRRIPSLGDWFGMNDERAILEATNHLIALGHRRIGYIGDVMFSTGKARYKQFLRTHLDFGRKVDETLIELGPPEVRFGATAVAKLLAKRPPPTAIITSSVLITLGVAEQLKTMNVDVPGDLSVVGFGDGAWQKWWGPGLTTFHLPAEEIANSCGLWFVQRLKSDRSRTQPALHSTISQAVFVLRNSTAPPRSS